MKKEVEKEMTTEELERHVVGFIVVAFGQSDGNKSIQLLPLSYYGLTDDGVEPHYDIASDNEIIGVIPWTRDLPKYPQKKAKKG